MTDSYIIRILRRRDRSNQQEHTAIVGTVEDPVSNSQQAFHSASELWAILEHNTAKTPTDKQSRLKK